MSGQVTLIGMGCGWNAVTREAEEALRRADALLGAARLLETLPDDCATIRLAETVPGKLLRLLRENIWEHPCVLYSGDTGFYSGARLLIPLLEADKIPYRVLPGVSSVQLLAARLGRPWQDWRLCSAHGADCDAVTAVSRGKAALFLTGTQSPAALCGQLAAAGLGNLPVVIGENLGGADEKITRTTARAAAYGAFSPLSVLLTEPAPMPYPERASGIPDADFIRGNVPMTKQEVRTAIMAKLAVCPGDTVWDVGAGTGAVSVELSRAARRGRVYALERGAEACDLIRRNREKFGAWNLTLIQGDAPAALEPLPPPGAAFIGGSGGELENIIETALRKNSSVRLCASAVTLETLCAAVTAFAVRGLDAEVCQIAVSRTRPAGKLHLLAAQNPVFLITAKGGSGAFAETSETAQGGGFAETSEAAEASEAAKGDAEQCGSATKGGGL